MISEEIWKLMDENLSTEMLNDPVMMQEFFTTYNIPTQDVYNEFPKDYVASWYTPDDLINAGIPTQAISQLYPADILVQSDSYQLGAITPDMLPNQTDVSTAQNIAGMGVLGGTPITLAEATAAGASRQDLMDMGFSTTDAATVPSTAMGMFNKTTGALNEGAKALGSAFGINNAADFAKIIKPATEIAGAATQNALAKASIDNAKNTYNTGLNNTLAQYKPFAETGTAAFNKAYDTYKSGIPAAPTLNGSLGQQAISADDWKQANITQGFQYDPNEYYNSPVYKALLNSGVQATDASAAAKGSFGSGNQLAELQKLGMATGANYMAQDFGQKNTMYNALNQAENQQYQHDTQRTQGLNESLNTTNAANIQYANQMAQQQFNNQLQNDEIAWNRLQNLGASGMTAADGVGAAYTNNANDLANLDLLRGGVNVGATGQIVKTVGNALVQPTSV